MNYNNIDGVFGSELRDAMMGEPPVEAMDDDELDKMLDDMYKDEEEDDDVVDVNYVDEGWFYNDKY